MPDKSTVMRWLGVNKAFQDQYARAREVQADYWAEEIVEISDDSSQDAITDPESGNTRQNSEFVARSRLRVDTRKWLMARMAPKKYGERVMQEVTGSDGGPVQIQKIERVIVRPDGNPPDQNG
jgi:hypothetical protein